MIIEALTIRPDALSVSTEAVIACMPVSVQVPSTGIEVLSIRIDVLSTSIDSDTCRSVLRLCPSLRMCLSVLRLYNSIEVIHYLAMPVSVEVLSINIEAVPEAVHQY